MASLRDLGLSEYEARAYRALLRSGPTTAKELSRKSEVPMGRIYDVLNGLEQHRLVRSQAASRPKKYVAVEPDVGLDRLLEAKQRELDEQAEQYAETVDTLMDDLEAAAPVNGQFWTAAVGPEETLELLLERIDAADEELVFVGGSPAAGLDLETATGRVVDRLESALDRGVEVQLLLTPEVVCDLPDERNVEYNERLDKYDNYSVRTHEAVEGTFNLIDDVEVCLEVPNPLDPQQAFAMIDLKDRNFAADVREVFQPRWENAEPLKLPQHQ
ncbi:TrmB family transcriptional regulator [Halonotius terrestris]|uniref:TrmB family transcriptional regulator n=1 Tax=Halonotius terrestris TaxID=2487750 RepID=A0A8J8PDC0_9EURY|nr:TrmB family transcriptional regulator [Halonotius terrestris]TQQ83286.1 TrmB family transcriptional regulator [Halonotius terrestris]